jgi:hypothetical protein
VPPIRGENGHPSLLANGNRTGIYYGLANLPRRYHPKEGSTSPAEAQYAN